MTQGNITIIRKALVEPSPENLNRLIESIRDKQAKKQAIESFLEKWSAARRIPVSMDGVSFHVPASPVRTDLKNELLEINETLKGLLQ